MLRIAAIFALTIYLTLSIGLHIDIDTCCKSIAGLSLVTEDKDHVDEIDCCAAMMEACCTSEHEKDTKRCPSDCVYIQVLSDQQHVSSPLELKLIPIDIAQTIDHLTESELIAESTAFLTYKEPPLRHEQELFMLYASFLTYG